MVDVSVVKTYIWSIFDFLWLLARIISEKTNFLTNKY